MNNFKENLKKHWKNLLIICAVVVCALGALAGIIISSRNKTEVTGTTYTVEVRGEDGQPVDEVYVALCDAEGNELTWLPYVSNITGEVKYTQDIKEGYYVKVVGVPLGYKLDESVKYSFNESGVAKVVLGEDDSVYVAKIGDNKFLSFSSAVGTANGSNDDVTIELLSDITINTANLNNPYGKSITINGNGHKVTTDGGNNVFVVNQKEGTISFENMDIKHKNTGAVVQMNGLVTVNMTDVNIDASDGTAYNYALLNTLAVDGTTTLNLTRVNAKMSVGSPAKANEAGIIRTGNTGGTKEVNINLVDCNLDTTEASGRQCIVVMKNTVATINATNSTFKSGDSYAIWACEQSKAQTLTMNNCTATATGEKSAKSPVEGYYAQIGNTYYLPLTAATKVANESNSNITLKLFKDITIKTCDINNKKGKLVTVDGGGRTVTTSGGNNAFVVGNNVMFKNMTINHKNTGSAIHITTAGNVSAQDVTIKATEGKTYSYSLINALATGKTKTTIDLTRVNVVWAVESKGDANASVIRTGNASVRDSNGEVITDNSKIVDIKLADCNFDTTKATGRTGITVTADSTTTVNLKNTTIKTKDTFAIRSNKQTIVWENADTTLTSLKKYNQDYPVEYYLAKIGEKFYTLEDAAEVANAAKSDTQIDLVEKYTIASIKLKNAAGKKITLNGNKKTITTTTPEGYEINNAFLVGNKVELKNMTIKHNKTGSAIQVTDVGTIDVSDVTINATEGKAYDWALVNMPLSDDGATEKAAAGEVITLNMTNVKATMSVAGRGKGDNAIIRTGNADKKNVNINLTNCNFNTEKATGRSGILVKEKTNATIVLTNTSMKTLDVPAVVLKDKENPQTMTMNNCKFDSVSAECKAQPIIGYDAKVGNVAHKAITQALKSVEKNGTVELLQDVSSGWAAVPNSCTIDGKGYTLTTTKGNADGDKHAFIIRDAEVTFKNMDIVHQRRGVLVLTEVPTTVTMENINIHAIPVVFNEKTGEQQSNEWALVNLTATAEEGEELAYTELIWKKVNVDMDAHNTMNAGSRGVIRTGDDGEAKKVKISLTDCKLDTTDAKGRHGIIVVNKTNADIELANTVIKTKNVPAIRTNTDTEGELTLPESAKLICGKKAEEHQGYTVQFGDTWHVKYSDSLWDAAEEATEDVTISLTTDTTLNLEGLKNNNGKRITINTAGCRLETTGTNDPSVTINSEASVAMDSKTVYLDLADVAAEVADATENADVKVNADWTVHLATLANANGKTVAIDSNGKTITGTGSLPANVTISSQVKCVSGETTYYATFESAALKAREASQASTITLSSDVTVGENINISNKNGKAVTIDGANKAYTITTTYKNALAVVDANSEVTLQNVKLKHTIEQGTVYVANTATLKLEKVEIDATNITDYQYGLINLYGKASTPTTMTLNMTDVTVNMDGTKIKSGSDHAIIRTGNNKDNKVAANTHEKTVVITMTNCNLNTGDATAINGIKIQDTTHANITLNNTNITTKNVVAINNTAAASGFTKTVEVNRAGGTFTCAEGVAKVGGELYTTLQAALDAAKAVDAETKIEIYSDISGDKLGAKESKDKNNNVTERYNELENTKKHKLILEGNWCSVNIALEKSKNALRVKSDADFKNMYLGYGGEQALLYATNAIKLKLSNVNIKAEYASNVDWKYGLINLPKASNNPKTELYLEDTDVTVIAPKAFSDSQIIRTGNGLEWNSDKTAIKTKNEKTVYIELKNSVLDITQAKSRGGIKIQNTTNAEIKMINSKILTDGSSAIQCNNSFTSATTPEYAPQLSRTISFEGNCVLSTALPTNVQVTAGEYSTSVNQVSMMSLEEDETVTLTLQVPKHLYELLKAVIQQFANEHEWNVQF